MEVDPSCLQPKEQFKGVGTTVCLLFHRYEHINATADGRLETLYMTAISTTTMLSKSH